MNISWVMMMNMGISAVISLFLPIVLLVVWKMKNRRIRMLPFIVGAGVFIIFALFLEQICHYFVLIRVSPLSEYVNGHIWVFALYGALAAGVFEETGRFLAFKTVLRRSKGKENAITYGIGHGGIESILVVGIYMISSLILVVAVSTMGGVENYVAMVPAEAQGALRENLNTLLLTPSYTFLLAGIERISTIFFHIALSVIVFFSAQRPGKLYLYPLAILIHTFLDLFAVMYQKGVIKNILIMEVLIIIITVATAYFAYRIYKEDVISA